MNFSASARRALPLVLAAAAAMTFAPERSAHAQGTATSRADALFAEGRDLLEKGRYAEACPKLAKSEELAPAVGTLLNLAYCWEQIGRLRSAMDAYAHAEAFASASGETKRAAFARDRHAAVEPRAMKLVVRVAPPEAPGLDVKRNGVAMAKTDLDRPIAVDPEESVLTASAPGYVTWKGAFIVKGEAGVLTMIVPPLAPLAKPEATRASPEARDLGPERVAALGLGAISALAIGAGVGMAFAAKSRYDDAATHCDDASCDATGNEIQRGAVTQGNIATVLVGLGLLSAGAGVYLWIVGGRGSERVAPVMPPAKKTSASIRLEMHPSGAAIGGLF